MIKTGRDKRVMDVADFLFANPMADRVSLMARFGKKWQVSVRTLDRIIASAKEVNDERVSEQEYAKKEVLVESATEAMSSSILSREAAAEILSEIAKGNPREVKDEKGNLVEILVPSDGDRVRSIQQIGKMYGWEAPAKVSNTITYDPFVNSPLNGLSVEQLDAIEAIMQQKS